MASNQLTPAAKNIISGFPSSTKAAYRPPSIGGDESLAALSIISSAANASPDHSWSTILILGAQLNSLACSGGTADTKTDLKVGLSPEPKARIAKATKRSLSVFCKGAHIWGRRTP